MECATAPEQHAVATTGVCSFYLPLEKAVKCFFCTAICHLPAIKSLFSLLSPRDEPELQKQGKRSLSGTGSSLLIAFIRTYCPGAMGGVKNLSLHRFSARPTCVCIVSATWQQPSNCSGNTRGGTKQPRLGGPGTCSVLRGGRGAGPAGRDLA